MPLWRRVEFHGGVVKYEINKEDNPIYTQLISILDEDQRKLLDAYLDKIEEFIPKGLIVSDNADSLRILNSEEAQEEEKLINELVEFAKNSLNPEICVEMLINSQGFKKILHRKKEVLELIKNG